MQLETTPTFLQPFNPFCAHGASSITVLTYRGGKVLGWYRWVGSGRYDGEERDIGCVHRAGLHVWVLGLAWVAAPTGVAI